MRTPTAQVMLKPRQVCLAPEIVFPFYQDTGSDEAFFERLHAAQVEALDALGMSFRMATVQDIPCIETLVRSRYDRETADEISAFDSYRYVLFGNVFLVHDTHNRLCACVYEVGYDHASRPSFLLRLIVQKESESLGLATILNRLSVASAALRGAKTRDALLDHCNHTSLYVHLNKIGSYLTDLVDVPCKGIEHHFVSSRPLTAQTVAANVINDDALHQLVNAPRLPPGLTLADADDLPRLRQLLRHEGFAVIAITRPGALSGCPKLLLAQMEPLTNGLPPTLWKSPR